MTAREWKPGDVADVLNEYGVWNRAICAVKAGERGFVWRYGVADAWAPLTAETRPLVVIDPEDRAAVERLRDVAEYAFNDVRYDGDGPTATDLMQSALRSLITPPKPPEPQGLGAVVEDADGETWVAADSENARWFHRIDKSNGEFRRYSDLTAVKVLGEGVS